MTLPRWLRVVISLGLLAWLLRGLDLAEAREILASATPAWLGLALLLALGVRALAAWRWYILLPGGDRERIGYANVLRMTLVSNVLGFFLVAGVGLEAVRVYGMQRATDDLALSVSTVLVDRVMALLALVLVVLVGLSLSPTELPDTIAQVAWLALLAVALGVAVLLLPAARAFTLHLTGRGILQPVGERLARLYDRLDAYLAQPGLLLRSGTVAIVFQGLRVSVALAIAFGLGLQVSPALFAVIMPVIIFITQLPVSIGGVGVREAGFVYLLGFAGVAAEPAFTVSILFFAAMFLSALPGGWIYARRGLAAGAAKSEQP